MTPDQPASDSAIECLYCNAPATDDGLCADCWRAVYPNDCDRLRDYASDSLTVLRDRRTNATGGERMDWTTNDAGHTVRTRGECTIVRYEPIYAFVSAYHGDIIIARAHLTVAAHLDAECDAIADRITAMVGRLRDTEPKPCTDDCVRGCCGWCAEVGL